MLKFFGFDIEKTGENEIKITFKVANLNGVDTIVQAFESGKACVEGNLASGLVGFIGVIGKLYGFIKRGKK